MQEMVEPDRTILIVSIIGLVVIWGSVAYHKFVQGPPSTPASPPPPPAEASADPPAAAAVASAPPPSGKAGRKGRRR